MMTSSDFDKCVYVNEYERVRFGRKEHVKDHWRGK